MAVVGFGFTKINVERKNKVTGKVEIKNNAAINSVEKEELTLGDIKQDALKFGFSFTVKYEPDMANIILEGEVLWVEKKEGIDAAIKQWKKEKKIKPEIMTPVLNAVLQKSNMQALILAKELNLPPPIPLPRVNMQPEEKPKK